MNHLTVMKQEVEKLEQIRNALSQGAVQADGLQQLVTKLVESEVAAVSEIIECFWLANSKFIKLTSKSP